MLIRVLLSTLATFLFLAGSAEVIRAAEKLPGGAFTFTSSPDEVNWRPFFLVERATVYRGVNGYAVDLIRIPPDKEVVPNVSLAHLVGLKAQYVEETGGYNRQATDAVMRVQSGTLYLALSEVGNTPSGDLIEYYPYGSGSVIVIPAGITLRMFAGDEEVVIEVTHIRNMTRRSSE